MGGNTRGACCPHNTMCMRYASSCYWILQAALGKTLNDVHCFYALFSNLLGKHLTGSGVSEQAGTFKGI